MTVTGTNAGCGTTTASNTVIVTVTAAPEAGVSGGAIAICSGDSLVEADLLANLIGEDAGGVWTDAGGNPVVFPITAAGDYTYTVTGTGACSTETDTAIISVTVVTSDIALVKTAVFTDEDGDGCADIGESIVYTFTVTNLGTSSLTGVTITDPLLEAPNPVVPIAFVSGDTDSDTELDSTETWVYTASYLITGVDIDLGMIMNQAFVTAMGCSGLVVNDSSGTLDNNDIETITTLCQNPDISLEKTGIFNDANADGFAQVGETITYNFTVINTGNVTLTNISIDDAMLGGNVCTIVSLDPGESNSSCSAVYVITQADIDNGSVSNQALVTAQDSNGNDVTDDSDDPLDTTDTDIDGDGDPDDITVVTFQDGPFEIFTAVSPNGDGLNDFFEIRGISNYPDNQVIIFNRWGVKVWETTGYDKLNNVFRGISDGRTTVKRNSELPTGTYYYILSFTGDNFPEGKRTYNGYLYINR